MKKQLSLLLSALMLVGTLSACGQKTPQTTTTSGNENQTVPEGATNELDLTPAQEVEYYQNPVLSSKKTGYGLGDPFVMRYNGRYYLYFTSTGNGLLCWSSDDLVHWKNEGLCARHPHSNGGYAPEVFYYNGMFYLYTSPNGNGHYVFASDSPTGMFKPVTGNLGMSIDGSVFIDKNGKWYFYTAGGNSITAYTMNSPTQMQSVGSLAVTSMNGWTEGPMVVYHDGYYYMTYTGNHFLHSAYRINYVAGNRSPLSFNFEGNNPLLISTDESVHHIGHSSTVKGPDLDSYYLVYHSMKDNGYNRDVNIDRIVFNGASMEIMGPTTDKQQVPSLPDLYARFAPGESLDGWTLEGSLAAGSGLNLTADSKLLSTRTFDGDYTAEFNVASIQSGGQAGAVFNYKDDHNYGTILFNPATQKVHISLVVDGKVTEKDVKMVRSFDEDVKFDCIQTLQIERKGDQFTFYMNDHPLCTISGEMDGGSIGYMTTGAQASFGFIGVTEAVGGNGSADEYKTVSHQNGLIPANTYTTGVYSTERKSNMEAVIVEEGNVLNYRIYAAANGYYDLSAEYYTGDEASSAQMEVYVDGAKACEVALAGSKSYTTAIQRGIPLTKGQHTVSFKLVSGKANFTEFVLLQSESVKEMNLDFSSASDKNVYTDGDWTIRNGAISISSTGKRLYGDKNWGDYTVEVEITPTSSIGCGVLVRATNPGATNYSANQPSADDAKNGTNWVEGYYIGLTQNSVILGKQSYSYTALTSSKTSIRLNTTYQLKVVCEGANLKVYLNGELCIDYTDDEPFMQGMAGLRTHQSAATYDNFHVTPIG